MAPSSPFLFASLDDSADAGISAASPPEVTDTTSTADVAIDNAPPMPENWDYAEIALLTLLFLIGAPLNLISLVRSLNASYSHNSARRTSSNARAIIMSNIILDPSSGKPFHACRQTTLRLHLTLANLMTVWIYGLSEIFWLVTYSWKGGDFLCRVIQFFYTFCFYATSNLTASIAVDRMCASVYRRKKRPSFLHCLRFSVWISWTLAFLSSVPQLFVWRTFSPFPDKWPDWAQCVSIWVIAKHRLDTALAAGNVTEGVDLMETQETLYNGFHLASVFWIPALIIVTSYVCIVTRLQLTIRETREEMARRCRLQRSSNAAMFRQHAGYLHRLGAVSAGDNGYSITPARTRAHLRSQAAPPPSPALLMELPIVIKSPQAFVCQPLLESFALISLVRAKWRTVRKTAYILLAYICCWSPYNILTLGRYIDPSFENGYLEVLSNLIVLNAVINPLIYGL